MASLSDISQPLTRGELAIIENFLLSDAGAKALYQMEQAMPLLHVRESRGWRSATQFLRGLVSPSPSTVDEQQEIT